jgi:hypothetical protein
MGKISDLGVNRGCITADRVEKLKKGRDQVY